MSRLEDLQPNSAGRGIIETNLILARLDKLPRDEEAQLKLQAPDSRSSIAPRRGKTTSAPALSGFARPRRWPTMV